MQKKQENCKGRESGLAGFCTESATFLWVSLFSKDAFLGALSRGDGRGGKGVAQVFVQAAKTPARKPFRR